MQRIQQITDISIHLYRKSLSVFLMSTAFIHCHTLFFFQYLFGEGCLYSLVLKIATDLMGSLKDGAPLIKPQ